MILHLTDPSGKPLTLAIIEFALREPLPSESKSGSRIMTSLGAFYVKETPAEVLNKVNDHPK